MTPERHAQDARDADGHGTLVRRVWRDAAHPGSDTPTLDVPGVDTETDSEYGRSGVGTTLE